MSQKNSHIQSHIKKMWVFYLISIYFILLSFSAVFGDQGLLRSYRLWEEKKSLQMQSLSLKEEVLVLNKSIGVFKDDLRAIERYAREELNMSKNNEIKIIFED